MSKGLAIRTLVSGVLFCIVSMWVMLYFADHKAISIENVAQDQVINLNDLPLETLNGNQNAEGSLRFRQSDEDTDYLCIPLPEGIKAENVTMENHYIDKQMWIYISGISQSFFDKEAVFGNISQITAGLYEVTTKGVLLKFTLTDVFEYKSVLEENHLYIRFIPPKEVYDKIIVIDAAGGGDDVGYYENSITEKNITLDIAKRLKELLEHSDIKVYYTRIDDSTISLEERVSLANAVRADMFIGIRVNHSDDTSIYGTEAFYNENYFIPNLGSVELADILERNVVTQISGRGNGLFACDKSDSLLTEAKVPVAAIAVGYISNDREAVLLQRDDYRDLIAEGLYQAILEAYD